MQKHQPFGWVKLKDTESWYYMIKGIASQVVIGFNETTFSYNKVFEDYTFANGTPFGVKIEDEQIMAWVAVDKIGEELISRT